MDPEIYTNHRGYACGMPLDGNLDGFGWHAWSGAHIGYGATEEDAIERVKDKLRGKKTRNCNT